MKKELLTLAVAIGLAFVTTASVARADEMMDGYCPMMTLKMSKELGLSKKQEAKIQEIKDALWKEMKPAVTKSSGQVEEVLSAKQEAKYKELVAAQGSCGCGKKDKGEEGGSCEGGKK